MYFLFEIRKRKFFLWTFDPARFDSQRTGFSIGLVVDDDSSADSRPVKLGHYQTDPIPTARPFACARSISRSAWPAQTFKSPIGRPIASTGRMFVVARRPSRQYRQTASKWIFATETAMARGSIGAFVKTAPINLRFA
jgi:hypothetical protein